MGSYSGSPCMISSPEKTGMKSNWFKFSAGMAMLLRLSGFRIKIRAGIPWFSSSTDAFNPRAFYTCNRSIQAFRDISWLPTTRAHCATCNVLTSLWPMKLRSRLTGEATRRDHRITKTSYIRCNTVLIHSKSLRFASSRLSYAVPGLNLYGILLGDAD